MKNRNCSKCGTPLNSYNPSHICYRCQEKMVDEKWESIKGQYVKVKDIAVILDVSEEQVRRLWREGRLPPAVSLIRVLKWDKEFFRSWIRSQHKAPPALGRQLEAFIATHGGLQVDEATGDYKLGKKEDFQILVYSKGKDGQVVREQVIISATIPGHYDT